MAISSLTLAVILKNFVDDEEFLLVKQTRPPKFRDDEYDSYVDSDLWDLPSTQLKPLEGESESHIAVEGAESFSGKINLRKFDIHSALSLALGQLGFCATDWGEWRFLKHLEEAEFGPGSPNHTVFIIGTLASENVNIPESCKWMSVQSCLSLLLEVRPNTDRMGPFTVIGLLNDSIQSEEKKFTSCSRYQEYPPGVILVPLGSRTGKPFHTTNLVVFAPENVLADHGNNSSIIYGDALIVDPGCRSEFHEELANIVSALPRRLLVFITHHHRDHVDGLSVIQKHNPDATLLAHENTMRRIGKDDWRLGYTPVSDSEDIDIRGQRLTALFAPGHTDGHMALLHVSTHSLIVGDHCVGNRRTREASILKAIETGAETLFDIVANVYSGVHRNFWIPASSNVRLHVDHLAQQDKLPKEVEWGKVSMIEAERRLLANALIDLSNQRFIFLSESCIPIFNFTTIYTYLINSTKNHVIVYDDQGPDGCDRYDINMFPEIFVDQWRKGSQWFEMDRDLAIEVCV